MTSAQTTRSGPPRLIQLDVILHCLVFFGSIGATGSFSRPPFWPKKY